MYNVYDKTSATTTTKIIKTELSGFSSYKMH